MQRSDFSMDLQHSLTRFHKSGMDPSPFPIHQGPVDCEDRLTAVKETPEQHHALISEGHVAPVPPYVNETMFEKPLTPSDVGKLNRLVIPKQYAEKYFPLGGGADAAGTLLEFEDEAGKCWPFRYSYWNSSQSYVLTKGWSRYVKEKCLKAGDAVVFERQRAEPKRLLIGWRRLGSAAPQQPPTASCYNAQGYGVGQDSKRGVVGVHPYQTDRRRVAGGGANQEEEEEEETVHGNGRRRVRLFGVDLESQLSHAQSSSASSVATSSHAPNSQQPIETQQQHVKEEAYGNGVYTNTGWSESPGMIRRPMHGCDIFWTHY